MAKNNDIQKSIWGKNKKVGRPRKSKKNKYGLRKSGRKN